MLKAKKFPKVFRILCVILMLTLLVPLALPVSANNSQDRLKLRERTGVALSSVDTTSDLKTDTTSAYAYNDASSVGINSVKVMGTPHQELTCWQGTDCTYGNYLSLPIGTARYLPNLVYERGYLGCGLVFNFQYTDAYIHIWWSPDSV